MTELNAALEAVNRIPDRTPEDLDRYLESQGYDPRQWREFMEAIAAQFPVDDVDSLQKAVLFGMTGGFMLALQMRRVMH